MKKIILLTLVLTLLFSSVIFYGCDKQPDDTDKNEPKIINEGDVISSQYELYGSEWNKEYVMKFVYLISDFFYDNPEQRINKDVDAMYRQIPVVTYDYYDQLNGVVIHYRKDGTSTNCGYVQAINIGDKYFVNDISSEKSTPFGEEHTAEEMRQVNLYYFGGSNYYLRQEDGTYSSILDDTVLTQSQAKEMNDAFVEENYTKE